jgi:hypothetical protein
LCRRGGKRTEAEGDWTAQGGCQGGCNAAGTAPFYYILSSYGQEQGGLLQTSDGSILGRDDDESKAASGGRRRNRKMRWGWCGCAVESFSAPADGDHVVASAQSGEQSEWAGVRKPLPGACDSAAHPAVTQIKSVIHM